MADIVDEINVRIHIIIDQRSGSAQMILLSFGLFLNFSLNIK